MTETDASARPVYDPARPTGLSTRSAWLTTGLLVVFMMVNFADKSVLGLAADPIRKDLRLTATQFGLANSAFFLLFSVAAAAVGLLADRLRARWLLLGMALLWSAAQLPVALGGGLAVLVGSRIVLGGAEGPAFPLAQRTSLGWFPDERRNLPGALVTLGVTFGVMVSAPGLTWVIDRHGWRSAFAVVALAGLLWAAAWWLFGREAPQPGPLPAPRTVPGGVTTTPAPSYRSIFATRTWIGCTIAYFTSYWVVALMLVWLPSYLHTALGYTTDHAATLVALPWALGAVVVLAQAALTSRLMRRGVSSRRARGAVGAGLLLVGAAGCLAVPLVGGNGPRTALLFLGFGFGGSLAGLASTCVAQITPASRRGGALGTMNAVVTTAGLLAPVLVGRLVDSDGAAGYQHAVVVSGALLLLGSLAAFALIDPDRDARALTG
ncbi:MFS transporter [Streptacidiphilus jiangxiensis]|uniref:Sugar phosphate permease n=1 Tax=Streptacidiphilus jiangxiensis TaxID=235985 RepID=A0A1H7ZYG7_STRJI|nr:MFS transporter [Streptacidiphilus jiangxiensis]SEM63361.1 Sugar phosphate permease [Streptacidiphilus jiangxiensis]